MKKSCKIEVECANCAKKMERAAAEVEGVEAVAINYLLQKIVVEIGEGHDARAVMAEVQRRCRRIEPDCTIAY